MLKTFFLVGFSALTVGVSAQSLPFDTSGLPFDTSGLPFDTSGLPFDTSGLPFDTSGLPFDTSGLPFDTNNTNKKGDTVIVKGTVKDSLNAPLANISVTVLVGGFTPSSAITNSSGVYEVKLSNSSAANNVNAVAKSGTKFGMANGKIDKPADGVTDIVEINITIGKMQAHNTRISSIRSNFNPSQIPSLYSISGQKITNGNLFMNKNLSTQMYINRNTLNNKSKSVILN